MLFLSVLGQVNLFIDWYYSATGFEFIKILFFLSKKNMDTLFLDFKKGLAWSFDSETPPKNVFHNISGIQKGCDINFYAVR